MSRNMLPHVSTSMSTQVYASLGKRLLLSLSLTVSAALVARMFIY